MVVVGVVAGAVVVGSVVAEARLFVGAGWVDFALCTVVIVIAVCVGGRSGLVFHPLSRQGVGGAYVGVSECAIVSKLCHRMVVQIKGLLVKSVAPELNHRVGAYAAVAFEPWVTRCRTYSGNEITAKKVILANMIMLGSPLLP